LIKWKMTEHLENGDMIYETIVGNRPDDLIVSKGEMVTDSLKQRLSLRGIKWVSVWENSINIEQLDPVFDQQQIKKFESDLESITKKILDDGRIDVEATEDIASDITNSIVTNYGEYLVPSLAQLKNFDEYTFTHQVNVSIISTMIAADFFSVDSPQLLKIATGGLLHDMGKLWIPPEILLSREKLADVEFNIIKKHPKYGHSIATYSGIDDETILNCILNHHERFDGKGYCSQLMGEDIPLVGRIMMVADVYDALTTVRPYKSAWTPYSTVSYIIKESKKMFDPHVVNAFLKMFGIYPVGTRLRLSTGDVATVIGVKRGSISRPVVSIENEREKIALDLNEEKKIKIEKVI